MWEARHGFPRAERLPSGHRRYPREEVERVLEVVRARDGGLSLAAAVERLAPAGAASPETSIYAGLRRRRPDLHPYPVPKRLLVAVSHAIEDECVGARRARPPPRLVPARGVLPRGRAALARVLTQRRAGDRARRLRAAGLSRRTGRSRCRSGATTRWPSEWAIVCDAPGFSACLAGRERQVTGERVFEVLWSVEPEVVRDAALIGLELASARLARARRPRAGAPVDVRRTRTGSGGAGHLDHQPDPRLRGGVGLEPGEVGAEVGQRGRISRVARRR